MAKTESFYTLLDHTADLGIRVWGADLKRLFENAGKALMQILLYGESLQKSLPKKISLSGDDLADLMVRWLGEILYLLDSRRFLVGAVESVELTKGDSGYNLKAVFKGDIQEQQYEIFGDVKAITYNEMLVQQSDPCMVQVVVDM